LGGHIRGAVNVVSRWMWPLFLSNLPSFCCHFCHYTGNPARNFTITEDPPNNLNQPANRSTASIASITPTPTSALLEGIIRRSGNSSSSIAM